MAPVVLLFFLFPTLLVLTVAVFGLRSGRDTSWKKKGLRVPPGNMGWPLLGETIAFRKLHPCTSLGPYMEEHIQKYFFFSFPFQRVSICDDNISMKF